MKPTGRGSNPRSRANLKPFKPGVSGNPGGVQKGVVYLSEAYKRLLKLSPDDILRYHARTTAEELALVQIKTAMAIGSPDSKLTKLGRFTLPAAKEIADRTEGKAKQRIDLDTQADLSLEASVTRIMEQGHCDRITAIRALAVHLPAALELLEEEAQE